MEANPVIAIHMLMKYVGTKFSVRANTESIIVKNEAAAKHFEAVLDWFFNMVTNAITNTELNIPWNNHCEVEVLIHSNIWTAVEALAGGEYTIIFYYLQVRRMSKQQI